MFTLHLLCNLSAKIKPFGEKGFIFCFIGFRFRVNLFVVRLYLMKTFLPLMMLIPLTALVRRWPRRS